MGLGLGSGQDLQAQPAAEVGIDPGLMSSRAHSQPACCVYPTELQCVAAQSPLLQPSAALHPLHHSLPGLHRVKNWSKTKWLEPTLGALLGGTMKDLSRGTAA